MPKKISALFLFIIMGQIYLFSHGESEKDFLPPYDPSVEGWQAVKILTGSVKQVDQKIFQLIYLDAQKKDPAALKTFLTDFFGQNLKIYAVSGIDFTIKSQKNNFFVTFKGDTSIPVLVQTTLSKQEWFGEAQIVSFRLISNEKNIPFLTKKQKKSYTFQGYLTLPLKKFSNNQTQTEITISQALLKLGEAIAKEKPPKTGRVWLLEHRMFSSQPERIGIFIKILVEFDI